MRRLVIISILSCLGVLSYAQSEEFNKVFEACKLAQSSMNFGEGSQNEIREAASMLAKAKWNPLILQGVDVEHEASVKNHLVFSPEYLKDIAEDRSVKRRAKEYAEELLATQRERGNVFLCTKCVKGRKQVVYALRHEGGNLNVATIAEINGLINLSVVVRDDKGYESKPYKITSEEFKGAPMRELKSIPVPEGNSIVYITIENKSPKNKSVAIIVE